MAERDTGEDKTDKAEEQRTAEAMHQRMNQMPFFEAVRPIEFAPLPKKESE